MQTQDFYEALDIIRKSTEPLTIVHTKLSLQNNEGGEISVLENVLPGPVRENIHDKSMIGFRSLTDDSIVHIYIHTILEYVDAKKNHYRLVL
jgi:hypothetical protein